MSDPELTRRLRGYFHRQINWFQVMLQDMKNLQERLDEADLDTILEKEAAHRREMTAFEEENRLLLRDWTQSTDLSGEERAEIQDLAAQAETLGREASKAYDAALAAVEEQLGEVRRSLGEVQQGRRTMRKYEAGEPDAGSDYLDRQA